SATRRRGSSLVALPPAALEWLAICRCDRQARNTDRMASKRIPAVPELAEYALPGPFAVSIKEDQVGCRLSLSPARSHQREERPQYENRYREPSAHERVPP